ncbi:HAD family hydrolase [Oscillatoria sp. FACHB-1407]|uniref:HAD-IIB family hydrolase n=1 Tax=Oscillatoria sp. FACHB-1407 TaxID=2692847 RepID=UPI0016836A6D|nr:HAD family hydrolase [Oscillatoria sp. FACHB-1407]MBD2460903.1 HAD family hydrolase [Oscillatoria sp. FACHB-1407]
MRYLAIAFDYDGTLATDGRVDDQTIDALERAKASGRKLILVTGRHLEDLLESFPRIDLFDLTVLENGALLYRPATREERPLGDRPSEAFVQALRDRQVDPLAIGRVIVATWHPHETTVMEVIRDLGLELQVIFNKGAVMVLPSGMNKATGLQAALEELGLSAHNTVGVGDAENDHAFLNWCECSVAVANALPTLKEKADWVTTGARGAGVVELIDRLIACDLSELDDQLERHNILLGTTIEQNTPLYMKPYRESILLAGTSGSGKSTLATEILERLSEQGYQFCIIDPEGDYENLSGAVMVGDARQVPNEKELLSLLHQSGQNVVVNLLRLALDQRPAFFTKLLPQLQELRVKTGRPHWLIVDEAHHLMPTSWQQTGLALPQELDRMIFITVHPDHVSPAALSSLTAIVALGETPDQTIQSFAGAINQPAPEMPALTLKSGEALAWFRHTELAPIHFCVAPPQTEHHRHRRLYAEGELGDDKCFYFRGKDGKLNLRAQNLVLFMQLAEGVDDETWLYHLQQGDYSNWFRVAIKDEGLAAEAEYIEGLSDVSPEKSRALIKAEIEQRYTLPI